MRDNEKKKKENKWKKNGGAEYIAFAFVRIIPRRRRPRPNYP